MHSGVMQAESAFWVTADSVWFFQSAVFLLRDPVFVFSQKQPLLMQSFLSFAGLNGS